MRRFLIPLLATALAAAAYGQRLDPADYDLNLYLLSI